MSDPSPPAEFDHFAGAYCDTLDNDLKFSGASSEYFARAKVDLLMEITRRWLGPTESLSCLDLGCGTGIAETFMAGRFARLVGVDVSTAMVEEARRRGLAAEFVHFEPGRVPFSDGAFDVSFCFCVMHHVPPTQRTAFVREMKRVTKPGGLLFSFEHNPLNPVTRHLVDICPFDKAAVLLRRGESLRRFAEAGLELVDRRFYLFFPGPLKFLRPLERTLGWLPLGGQYLVAARRPREPVA